MVDVVSPEIRSRMMSGIRGKNTKPEMIVRKGLHRLGFRYKLHEKKLPGKPDLVLPKYKAVIFVHGCFWHKHDCKYFKWPKTRTEFWRDKINRNVTRDKLAISTLRSEGWRVSVVWECAFKHKDNAFDIIKLLADWLNSDLQEVELSGEGLWS